MVSVFSRNTPKALMFDDNVKSKRRSTTRKTEPRRVALLVDTSTAWGRGIITGVHRYNEKHQRWHLFFQARGVEESLLLPPAWKGDGVIARLGNPAIDRTLLRLGLPVVNVSSINLPNSSAPRVANDLEAAARMAVDYYHGRGFRHYAYLSLIGLDYVSRQRAAFVQAVKQIGGTCQVKHLRTQQRTQASAWNLHIEGLTEWLHSLPKPTAMLMWSGGADVVHACLSGGIRVPEEIALMVASDDDLLCSCSPIPLSGVRIDSERIGYAAAEHLGRLLRGAKPRPSTRWIAPLGVTTRQSTDTLAIADPHLRNAVEFIRMSLDRRIDVDQVAARAGVSRRLLELRFHESLRTSPAAYIQLSRLQKARRLLRETHLSIAAVAEACGFSSQEYLSVLFRQHYQTTPLRCRRESTDYRLR